MLLFFANISYATTGAEVNNLFLNGGTLTLNSNVTGPAFGYAFNNINISTPINLHFNGYAFENSYFAAESLSAVINFYDANFIGTTFTSAGTTTFNGNKG